MSDIFFLLLRRLRTPLILLITVYALATLGMTLITGVDPDGEPWRMSFFHAFYFVSFMGTTIGFGEIPYPFNDAQRAWVLVCIYTSVIAWLYAIGSMLRLTQDETFQHAVARTKFVISIRRIDLPFYIICGYGEAGSLINRGLAELGIQTVIIDHNPDSTTSIELENLRIAPIILNEDVTEPSNLVIGGINHPQCQGVIAVTSLDHTNLEVAVACKLLNPKMRVICRSEIEDEADNMASFGTDFIINPYLIFARRLSLLTRNPALHKVHNWFINQLSAEHIDNKVSQNGLPKGRWILCGYGRFGKAVQQHCDNNEIEIVIIDVDPQNHNAPVDTIEGRGTEAKTLIEAGIEDASVIIAASNDDANNLSILITAKHLNKDIYTIGRVSKEANHPLFVMAHCDYIMRRSQIVANEVLTLISRPLVTRFLQHSNTLNSGETSQLIEKISTLSGNADPITWRLIINQKNAPALARFIDSGCSLSIGDVTSHQTLPGDTCIPLLLQRGSESKLLPSDNTEMALDDELLVCANRYRTNLPQRLSDNAELVDSLINNNPHHIPLLRWRSRRKAHKTQ